MREFPGEVVDDIPHYLVEWCPTLVSKDCMWYTTEFVAQFKARQAQIRSGLEVKRKRRERPGLRQGKPSASCRPQETKKPRGRPKTPR